MNTKLEISPSYWIIALGLFIAAILLRTYGISEWHLIGDEYFSHYNAHERYTSTINPAYYALVVFTQTIFGDAEWTSRIPAFIFSVISVPLLYLVWSRVIGRNAAIFAAVITLFSAWHLWFSQFARFYMGVFLFAIVAYYYFYSALINNNPKHLVYALIFSVLGILFHATFVLIPASCAVAYLFAILIRSKQDIAYSTRIPKIYLGLCFLMAIPLAYFFLMKLINIWLTLDQTWGYGPLLIIPQIVKYVQIPIVAAAFFGWLALLSRNLLLAGYLAIMILTPYLCLMLLSNWMSVRPDYIFYTLAPILVLAGIACEEVRRRFSDARMASMVLIVTIIICLLPEFVSHFSAKKSLNLKESIAFIEDNYQKDDQIMSFIQGFDEDTKSRYDLLPFISSERDSRVNWDKELKHLLETEKRTWIVVTSKRQKLSYKLENWLLCHSSLVKRTNAKRMDYEVDGHQVFLVHGRQASTNIIKGCT